MDSAARVYRIQIINENVNFAINEVRLYLRYQITIARECITSRLLEQIKVVKIQQ